MGNNELVPVDDEIAPHVDLTRALKLRLRHHWTFEQIAKDMGVTKQAVAQRLQRFTNLVKDPHAADQYRENEAVLLDAARLQVVTSLIDKIPDKKTTVGHLAYTFRQLFDSTRLLRDQSTANVNQLSAIIHAAAGTNPPDEVVSTTPDVVLSTSPDGDTANPAT